LPEKPLLDEATNRQMWLKDNGKGFQTRTADFYALAGDA